MPDAELPVALALAAADAGDSQDPLARPALTAAELHPLLLNDSADATPGPSTTQHRPLWNPKAEPNAPAGPSMYFDLKSLHERLEAGQQAAPSVRTRSVVDGFDSDSSSLRPRADHGNPTDDDDEDDCEEAEEDDERAEGSVSLSAPTACRYDVEDETNAEFAAALSSTSARSPAGDRRWPTALVAPQPRTPIGFQACPRSASQTPQQASNRPTRASSRASQRQGALSPFGRAAFDGRQIARPPSSLQTVGDPEDEDLVGPSIDTMVSLHAMSDGDLSKLLAGGPCCGERRTESALAIGSPQPRRSVDAPSEATNEDAPPTPKAIPSALSATRVRTNALLRSLSLALSDALADAAKAKTSAIKERAANQEAVEYMNQQHHSRESALKELCRQHGIKEGEISRCLLRAPVFDAEATKKRIESRGQVMTTPKPTAADATFRIPKSSGDTAKRDEDSVISLPQSLQEAMLEGLEGVSNLGETSPAASAISHMGSSRDRSPSVTSFRTEASAASFNRLKRSDGRNRGSHADLRAEISSIGSSSRSPTAVTSPGKPNRLSRPAPMRSSSSVSATYRGQTSTTGLGEWASGLMPWANSSTSRKAAASTAPSNVRVTSPGRHTVSEGVLSDEADPFETPVKSKSTTALPEQDIQAAKAAPEEERGEATTAHARSRSVSSPRTMVVSEVGRPPSRSGLGIFGTLAWRRKKLSAEQRGQTSAASEDESSSVHRLGASGVAAKAVNDLEATTVPPAATGTARASSTVSEVQSDEVLQQQQKQHSGNDSEITVADRPIAIRRSSSKSMPVALHEAIGPEPTSPLTERLQAQLGLPPDVLPKPAHFKAIFLATRIMTPDPSSLLYDSGKKTSELIASLAMSLVGRARDEGKMVEEPPKSAGVRRASGPMPRPMSMAHAMLTQTVEEQAKRADPGRAGQSAAVSKAASSTTFARAFGRYTRPSVNDSSGCPIEPNVTRLPDMYRFTAANAPAPATPGGGENASSTDSPLGAPRPPAAPVELEAIVPSEAAPPTLAKKRSKKGKGGDKSKLTALGASRTALATVQRGRLDPLDEESSGDEFEVYGGKGPASGYGPSEADEAVDEDDDDDDSEEEAEILTDRYGFIYDATPADIRLLRQARKAATPAPACLTGIRVGVRARGGTDSQSEEEKEDPDYVEMDSEEDEAPLAGLSSPIDDPSAEDAELDSESESFATTGNTSAPSEGGDSNGAAARRKDKKGLFSLAHAKPTIEALSVSVTSQPSIASTKRSRSRKTASSNDEAGSGGSPRSAELQAGRGSSGAVPRVTKPATSETVRRLLSQLQVMHETQQTTNKAKWDEFLQRRRERLSRANLEAANSLAGGSASASHARRGSVSSQQRFGIAGLSSSEKAPEEDWSQGMVGINRMGDSKAGKEDWKHFLSLCQAGIPLCYRAKIWAECSGANEVHEPGRYQELLNEHQGETNQCLTQIDLDVHRTMPTNIFFAGDGQGVPKLRRLLVAFSWYNPACGYCQGMNNLAATLLLTHATEEEAFWVLVCIIEKILPSEYYTSHLLVSQADQRVLIELVDELMPALSAHIADLGVDLPAVTFAWFLSLYTDCLPVETLFRVWDVMFVEGMVILFRVAIAILKMNEAELLATTSAAAFYGQVHSMTSRLFSVDRLIKLACEDLKQLIRYAVILEKRERHVADLTRELGLDQSP